MKSKNLDSGYSSLKSGEDFLSIFSKWSWIALGLSSFLQCLFWPDINNIFAVFVVLIAWKILTTFVLKYDILNKYALSSFIIFGYIFTQFYIPLVFTLTEGKPIIYNLKLPVEIFLHGLLDVIVVTIVHILYRNFNKKIKLDGLQKLLIKANFFKAPSDAQIWIMGFIGLFAMLYSTFGAERGQEFTGTGNKFISGFIPFVYTPFYIFFKKLLATGKSELQKNAVIKLSIYTVLIFALSIMRNSRGAFMYGFAGLGYGYLLGLFLNFYKPNFFTRKNLIIGAVGIWLITGPLVDLGTAMVLARASRGSVSATELLSETLSIYNQKELIYKFNATKDLDVGDWDERYLNNLFLARLSNLKISDGSLVQAEKIGGVNEDFQSYSVDRFFATLPQPVIDILGFSVNKDKVNSYSFGDALYDKAGGSDALGGFRTGHIDGTGMVAFGWWYLIILGVGIVPAFYLFDCLQLSVQRQIGTVRRRISMFSLCGLLSLISMFSFLVNESVVNIYIYVLRGWIQMVFLYFVVYYISSWFSSSINKNS